MSDAQATASLIDNDPYLYQLHWSLIGMLVMGVTEQ